ncbi:hypothetical protein DKX38_023923 [Salix brachista]|uniref:7,8-dihydroneopterin aldolase n=1 Tax=Salix brachista TaxID=2182728 RepID=A0A5N5JNV8_9ROSI|nr:hypothetical protein DKX38_023923 [Salix brachista]
MTQACKPRVAHASRLPEILLVHLKRFSYSKFIAIGRESADRAIPQRDTCMRHSSFRQSNLRIWKIERMIRRREVFYKFYRLMQLGNRKCYKFDDNRASPVREDDIKTSAAYLVFIDHLQSCPRMSLEIASERVCYVHCNFCNTILVVNIPCSNNSIELNTVTVRCGHCANLLSLNTGSLLQTAHLQDSHKQNLLYQDLSEGSSSTGNKVSALEPSRNEQPGRTVAVHAAMGKKQQRTPSAYNRFIKEEIRRIKAKNPEISHREAFSNAAKNFVDFNEFSLWEDPKTSILSLIAAKLYPIILYTQKNASSPDAYLSRATDRVVMSKGHHHSIASKTSIPFGWVPTHESQHKFSQLLSEAPKSPISSRFKYITFAIRSLLKHPFSFHNPESNRWIDSVSKIDGLGKEAAMGDEEIRGGDKLILRGLKFHGFHGVKPEERALGQKFLIDVDAWMDLRAAGKSDCLSDTISYTEIYRIAKEIAEGPPQNLLESVAQLIASTTLSRYPQISAVRVKVGKPHVAVHGILDYLGVEILRHS